VVDKSFGKNNPNVTFSHIIKTLVKSITYTTLNKYCFDQSEIILNMKADTANDAQRKEALSISIKLLGLYHQNKHLVEIEWTEFKNWVIDFSKTISNFVAEQEAELVGKENQKELLSKNFEKDVQRLDSIIFKSKNKELMSFFRDMGSISDLILYILFGLSMNAENKPDDFPVTTRVLCLNMLLVRTKKKKSIIELKKAADEEKDVDIFWTLPLAYAMELHGIGREVVADEEEKVNISVDDFLKSALST
jgi:hypothetical protein